MTSTAPLDTRPAGSAERRRPIDWLVALLWSGAIVAATVQQGVTSQNNNFRIFRAASRHLFAGSDLYAAYPAEHFDFYKYSPTFALLFAPFAYVPFAPAMLLWNALNAGALYVAHRARAAAPGRDRGAGDRVPRHARLAPERAEQRARRGADGVHLRGVRAPPHRAREPRGRHRHVRQAVPARRRELRHLPPAQAPRGDRGRAGHGAVRGPPAARHVARSAARAVRGVARDPGDRLAESRLHGDAR